MGQEQFKQPVNSFLTALRVRIKLYLPKEDAVKPRKVRASGLAYLYGYPPYLYGYL